MESQKVEEKKCKRRKVSILTVFLWLFLITTMSTVTIESLTQKNAIEITDNNWNVSLVMYDRSGNNPDQAITDFTWNATKTEDEKQLAMQINYACTTGKEYQPGEIVVEIPGIAKESFSEYWRNETSDRLSYSYWLANNVVIAADKLNSKDKKYDWSYVYDEENNLYTFTNNMVIEENEHFEGTIQIVYNLLPRLKVKTDLEFQVKMKENIRSDEIIAMESNVCNFHYTGSKKSYSLIKEAEAAPKVDYTPIENIFDDYYWVRYSFLLNDSLTGVIRAYGDNDSILLSSNDCDICIKDTLPEGCVLYDEDFNQVKPQTGNTYYYLNGCRNTSYDYYVGYPKSKYQEGNSITNTAELWGRYEDEEEMQKLVQNTVTVSLVDFDFEYTGELYAISKNSPWGVGTVNQIQSEKGNEDSWDLENIIAFYTGKKMDVEIADDLLYMTRKNGSVTKLTDDEYHFISVSIPVFYTYNRYNDGQGAPLIGYEWELQVRYKDQKNYVSYQTGTTGEKSQFIKFDNNNIVGLKVIIKDLDKTLYNVKNPVSVKTNIHTQDCAIGKIYNFDYLQVYQKDGQGNRTLVNEPPLSSYVTPSTLKIAEYDQATYGTYMQRGYAEIPIREGKFSLFAYKTGEKLQNDAAEEKYTYTYRLQAQASLEYYDVDKDVIIKTYDILPKGMYLSSTKEEIIKSMWPYSFFNSNIKLKDGTTFKNSNEFLEYLRTRLQIDIDYNYKNSGRTKLSILLDLNEIDLSYYLTNWTTITIDYDVKVEVPYESILEYGTSYTNYVYMLWNNQEYEYDYRAIQDNGKLDSLARDIDQDGNTTEELVYFEEVLNITHAVSSQQAVIKQVRTDLTQGKYVEGTAEVSPGGEYDYKLRVTTGANRIKDLIIYDHLETIFDDSGAPINQGWKGTFLGVDTSYAESKGYAPKVYYSTELNPGKLTEVPDKWKLLDDSVNKSTVKSICIDLRYKADGSEMELSPNNAMFVLVKMQAPNDQNLMTSSNNKFSTNWRAIDPLGGIIDNIEGIYSNQVNVEISKKGITKSISGQKTWIDGENKYQVRPVSITVKLMQDGKEYTRKTVTEADNWSYTFENVPVYRDNVGNQYEYRIEEVAVENYVTSYEGNNITNEVNLTEFAVEKVWKDDENKNNKRPDSIVVELKKEGNPIQEVTLNELNHWKYTFTNLEKYDESGKEIVYTVDEQAFENDKFYVKEIVGGKITNTFVVPDERIKIVGVKEWDDNNNLAEKRPESVILQVKNGEEVVTEQVVTEETNWSYEFELAKYDESGNEIVYTIDEKEVESKFYEKVGVEGNVVTNKFIVPDEKIEIWVDKKWEDNNDEYGKRPKSVILQIKNGDTVVEEVEVSEEENWKHKFVLTKYDELGNEINYTVDEKETDKYYEKRIEGNTVINICTYNPLTDTSDISIWIYVVVAVIAVCGIGVFVFVKVRQKKN